MHDGRTIGEVLLGVGHGDVAGGVLSGDDDGIGSAGDVHHPPCAACGHVHRVTKKLGGIETTYDETCGYEYGGHGFRCPCIANGDAYDRHIAAVDDYIVVRTAVNGSTVTYRQRPERSDNAAPAPAVDTSGSMRRGRLDRGIWGGLSRFVGDLGGQLVGQRGHLRYVRGRTDHRGAADPVESTGPERVRGVVNWDDMFPEDAA